MRLRRLGFLLGVGLLGACAGQGSGGSSVEAHPAQAPSEPRLGRERFVVIGDDSELSIEESELSGRGTIRFREDLGSWASNFHFNLEFSLEDGGELVFVSHASESLEKGLSVRFMRAGGALGVSAEAGTRVDDWSPFFAWASGEEHVRLAFDVHNEEAVAHFLFWRLGASSPFLDTGVDIDGGPGRGLDRHWGLRLSGARITFVFKGGPRDAHGR